MDDPSPPALTSSELMRYALDFGARAYDEHKSHARFQEQQRSWILVAYLTFSGVLISSVTTNLQKEGFVIETAKPIFTLILFFHLAVSLLANLAISKVSREFRRHFKQANFIVDNIQNSVAAEAPEAAALLRACTIGTSGDHLAGFDRFMAKRFGVAAVHNYLLSLFIGFDAGMITLVQTRNVPVSVTIFAAIAVVSAALFTVHNKRLEVKPPDRQGPPPTG